MLLADVLLRQEESERWPCERLACVELVAAGKDPDCMSGRQPMQSSTAEPRRKFS